jgi:hypothetical protein
MDGNLRRIFRTNIRAVHWVSIESPSTEPGIPDLNGCYNGVEFWVENKLTHGFAVSNILPEQIGWHLRRVRAGGRTFVAVRRSKPRVDELYIIAGSNIARLAEAGLTATPLLGKWAGGPARWGWSDILPLFLNFKLIG